MAVPVFPISFSCKYVGNILFHMDLQIFRRRVWYSGMGGVTEKLEEKIANAGRPYASRIAIGGSPGKSS